MAIGNSRIDTNLPDEEAAWWGVRAPLSDMPAEWRARFEELASKYPEMRGRLTSSLPNSEDHSRRSDPTAVIEAHIHCAGTSLEIEWQLAALGFQPDFFICCVPDAYVSCWTLRLQQIHMAGRNRFAELFEFTQRQLEKAQMVLCGYPGPAYSEVELYRRSSYRKWQFARSICEVSDALTQFPFSPGEFENDNSIAWVDSVSGCGFDVSHKNWDVHVKLANLSKARGINWSRDSLLRKSVDCFQIAGFYRAVSDSGGLFLTVQLRSRQEATSAYRKVVQWADRFPGILESVKLERCPMVWAKGIAGIAKSPLSPLPPLMRLACR